MIILADRNRDASTEYDANASRSPERPASARRPEPGAAGSAAKDDQRHSAIRPRECLISSDAALTSATTSSAVARSAPPQNDPDHCAEPPVQMAPRAPRTVLKFSRRPQGGAQKFAWLLQRIAQPNGSQTSQSLRQLFDESLPRGGAALRVLPGYYRRAVSARRSAGCPANPEQQKCGVRLVEAWGVSIGDVPDMGVS